MQIIYIVFSVGLLCFVLGRFIGIRAKRLLNPEQKAIVPSTPRYRRCWWLSVLAIFVLSIVITECTRGSRLASNGFLILFSVVCAAFAVADFRRLSRSGLPSAYLRSVRTDLLLSVFGLFLLVAAEVYREQVYVGH